MKKINEIIVTLFICLLFVSSVYSQDIINKHGREDYKFPILPKIKSDKVSADSIIKKDYFLTLRDGIVLDCSKFYPSEPNIYLPDGYPAVIMCHGFGDRKETLEQFALAQASYGYVVYTYSMRGQGNSGGLSNLISIIEAQDLIEFVTDVKKDTVSGLDTNNILIMGGSQGAIIPYMAACNGLKVKTIISALGSPEFASSWIDNGSVKMTFLWTIEYTPDTARYTPVVDAMSNWVYATGVKSNKWDSLAYYVPLGRDFLYKVQSNQIPILIENSWQDYFFNAYNVINSLPKIQPFYRTYFGAVMGHGGDTSGTENVWHMNFFNEWFFYHLFGIDNGILTRPKYHYAFTSSPVNSINMWKFIHDSSSVWPPQGIANKKYYFNDKNFLTTKQVSSTTLNKSFKNDIRKSNYSLKRAVNEEFKGVNFDAAFKTSEIYFQTDVLNSDVKMLGTPKLNLDYQASADICQYNFQIFEVFSDGTKKLVTRINYTDRKYTANTRIVKSIYGNSHAHIFKAGSKIRIVVTNLDRTPDDVRFLATNPFVLPVMKNSINKIYLRNTYVELPILQNAYIDLLSQYNLKNQNLMLSNYPNPFNPATKIKFRIPDNFKGLVTLKIYDITGKEVANLINDNLSPGFHEINWDASNYSSGAYFYKITAGSSTEVKRMMLIK